MKTAQLGLLPRKDFIRVFLPSTVAFGPAAAMVVDNLLPPVLNRFPIFSFLNFIPQVLIRRI
ncbi:hypothetical protein D3C74_344970 [compost metagenome]